MGDQSVDPDVVAERFERLRAVVERSALIRHQARVGRREEVLVEGASSRDDTVWSGRTRQNKLVHVPGDSDRARWPRPGAYATVDIVGAAPHFLRGRLVAVTAPPRHRVKVGLSIPVAAR